MRLVLQILNVTITTVLILVIGAAGYLAFVARRSPDGVPAVAGYKVLTVPSGAMEPSIHKGDVIVVAPLRQPGPEPKDGDIITYRAGETAGTLITQRIVGTVRIDGQVAAYVTKGDASGPEDQTPVTPEQVVGIYRWRVPYFGHVAAFVRQPAGLILLVILPGVVLIGLQFKRR